MLKMLLGLLARQRGQPDVDGNQERPLPQRWRDPPPPPERDSLFGQRAQ